MYNRLKNKVKAKEDIEETIPWKQHNMSDKDGTIFIRKRKTVVSDGTGSVWLYQHLDVWMYWTEKKWTQEMCILFCFPTLPLTSDLMLNELLTCLLKLLKCLFKYPFEVIKPGWKQVVNCLGSETASGRELREVTELFRATWLRWGGSNVISGTTFW